MKSSPFRVQRLALYGIVLLAFALRVYRLDAQALWWDESLSVYRATRDLATVFANTIRIQNILTVDTLPQLYFVLLNLFARAAGISEFALRFFSVVANVATTPLLFVLARRWFAPSMALLAASLGTLAPLYVWYAQEARPYALVLFWSTLAVYALARACASRLWLGVYVVSGIAALYTHYYSIFLLPFHFVVLVWWQKNSKRWSERAYVLLPLVPLAATIFLLPQIRASAAGNAGTGPYFVPLEIILRDLLNSFSVGITIDLTSAWWFDGVWLGLWLIGIALPNVMNNRRAEFQLFDLAYLFVPIACVQILSYFRPLYQNSRYLIALSPAFYLGVAAGIGALMQRWKPAALAALSVCLIGTGMSLNNLYFDPRWGKDDHRAWAVSLRERARPGDFLILDSPHTEELYRYYAGDMMPMTTLPILRADGKSSPEIDLQIVREAYRQNVRVWFLAMHTPFDDPENRIDKILNQEGVLLDQAEFAGTSTQILLSQFMHALPIVEPSDIQHPLDIAFAGHLRLRGYALASGIVKLYWQLAEPVGEDYAVSLRLVDLAGKSAGQWDAVPLGNRAGSSTWRAGQIIEETRAVVVPRPPGIYRLQVVPYHAATGFALGEVITLGEISIP